MSFQVPEELGSELEFPAVQTYSNGERVRWIGPEDAEEPAPVVTVLEGASEGQATAQAPANTATPEPAAAEDDGGTDTPSIIALVVGAAGLLAGGLALVRVRGPRRVAT